MNRLPLPNWNYPTNMTPMNDFAPMNVGYGSVPFGHPNQHFPPPYMKGRQNMFVPRHPVHINYKQPNFEPSRVNGNHNHQKLPAARTKEFSCDVCEKSFQTQHILRGHLQSHVKCDFEGCSFSASRKILKLHFIQNHAKGRMRIKLETPEEIEKWREKRRKNYPTVANVEKKFAEGKARRESGQIAETQTFRYRGNKRQRNWNKQNSRHQKQNQNHSITSKADELQTRQERVENNKVKEITGDPLSVLLGSSKNESDEEEAVNQSMIAPQLPPEPSPPAALASLCDYGGDSSSDENDTEKELNNNDQEMKPTQEPAPYEKTPHKIENSVQQQRKSRKRKQDLQKKCPQTKRRVTLLEKLLAPEIRHERNVILQCIRYIIKNNYFDAD